MKSVMQNTFLAVLIVFSLCSPTGAARADAPQWKIGVLLCLTGACAELGQGTLRGIQLAAGEINANGGVNGRLINLAVQETAEATSGAKAVTAYRQLRTDPEIFFFIGPTWTPGGLALIPIVSRDPGVLIASPSLGAAEFHQGADNIFNVRGTDETSSRTSARFAFSQGHRRAAIISSQQPWDSAQARAFEDEFRRLGGEVVAKEEPLPDVTDLSAESLRIVRAKPQVVFFATMLVMAKGARELKRYGYDGAKMASYIDLSILHEARGTLENTIFFSFQKPSQEFREKFLAGYRVEPVAEAGFGYDTLKAFAAAAEQVKSFDAGLVAQALLKIRIPGASGVLEFDEAGCAKRQLQGYKVSGDNFVPAD